jgi:glycosyltransferase involved in cell wall biosynthesis
MRGESLKIAMYNLTTTCRFGGVETFVWSISRELAKRGEEVHVIGGRGKIGNDASQFKVIQFPFWPRHRVPNLGTRFRKLVERWSLGLFAFPTLLGENYDIFHIHKPYDLPIGVMVKKFSGAKLILGCHGRDFFWGDRFFAQKTDVSVSCSHFNGKDIENRYGLRPKVIYNGIDPEVFHPLPPNPMIYDRLGLRGKENKIIVYVGRLIGLKGVGELLQATAILQKKMRLSLVIIGDGEGRVDLQKRSDQLGIAENVIFTGFIPNHELPNYYSVADVAVFPSVADETFGLAICEAMACGKAVVSTRVGGIPELVIDGESGRLVDPKNPDAIANTIYEILHQERLQRSLGENATRRVQEYFTWEKVADRLVSIYSGVLNLKSPGLRGSKAYGNPKET